VCRRGWFSAPQLWRFETRQADMKLDAGGQRAIKTVASDGVGTDRGCSRGVSSAATMTPAVAGAALPSRWLIEQRRQAHRALNEHDGHRARAIGGARIVWPRVKVCRMSIARPQCMHTKLGCLMPMSSPPAGATATAGSRNSSRARARLGLRLPLASSP